MPNYNSSFPISDQMEYAVWFTEPKWMEALVIRHFQKDHADLKVGVAAGLERLSRESYPEDAVRAWVILPGTLLPAELRPTSNMIGMCVQQSIVKNSGQDIGSVHGIFPDELDALTKGIIDGVKKLVDDKKSKTARNAIAKLPEGLKIGSVWNALDGVLERFRAQSGFYKSTFMGTTTLGIEVGAPRPITITIDRYAPETSLQVIKRWGTNSDKITPLQREYYINTTLKLLADAAEESMGSQKRKIAKAELRRRLRQVDKLSIQIEPQLRQRIATIAATQG